MSNRFSIHQHTEQKKELFIAPLNINGLRCHFDEISSSLNETKVDNLYSKQLTDILGYQQERKDRTAHGGAIALYIREPIQYTRRTDLLSQELELISVEIQPPKSKSYIVIAWYRPPSDPVGSFNKFEKILLYLDQEGKEIIYLATHTEILLKSSKTIKLYECNTSPQNL